MTALVGSLTVPLRNNRANVALEGVDAGELQPDRLDQRDDDDEGEGLRSLESEAGEVARRASFGVGAARGLTYLSAGSIVRTAGALEKTTLADPLRPRPPSEPSSTGTSSTLTG